MRECQQNPVETLSSVVATEAASNLLHKTMQRRYRLKKRSAFAYVYRKGVRASASDLLLLSAKSREGLKIGLSVSKKVGNAVTRNRTKRLIREAIAKIEGRIDEKFMYVIAAYPSIVGKTYLEVCEMVETAFNKAGKLREDV